MESFGVAGGDDETLLAADEGDEGDGGIGEVFGEIGVVVGAGIGVEEVGAGEVGFAAAEGDEAAETAGVGRGEATATRGEELSE